MAEVFYHEVQREKDALNRCAERYSLVAQSSGLLAGFEVLVCATHVCTPSHHLRAVLHR